MSYLNRNSTRKSALSAELVYLFFALAAGAATFWYAGHKIGMDLSSISTAASILGIGHTALRYDPRASTVQDQPAQVVGTVKAEEQATAASAPNCAGGAVPAFVNGMAELKAQLGDVMGTPTECEHAA